MSPFHGGNGDMLKGTLLPGCAGHGMAGFTIQLKSCFGMIGIGRLLKRRSVASLAFCWRTHKSGFPGPLVAGLTIHRGMNASKGKTTVFMKLQNVLLGHPPVGSVAPLTIQTQCRLVNIGMAIGAGNPDVAKF